MPRISRDSFLMLVTAIVMMLGTAFNTAQTIYGQEEKYPGVKGVSFQGPCTNCPSSAWNCNTCP